MPIRSVLIGSVLLTGLFSGNASATTFNISFTQSGLDDSGPDWLGTFDAPESGGLLSAINVNIGGNIYDELGQPPGFSGYRLSYDATKNVLTGTPFWWGTAYNGFPVVSGTLSLGIYSTGIWGIYTCQSSSLCEFNGVSGTYRISAVPVPAALPLLASGFGALGVIGWRRRHKAPA